MTYELQMFLEGYESYLVAVEGISSGDSAKSYVSYCKKACNRTGRQDFLQRIAESTDFQVQLSYCFVLLSELYKIVEFDPSTETIIYHDINAIRKLERYIRHKAGSHVWKIPGKKARSPQSPKSKNALPCLVDFGDDEATPHVSYHENAQGLHVEGLCGRIEEVYSLVVWFANKVFGPSCTQWDDSKIPIVLSAECPVDYYPKGDSYIAKELAEMGEQKQRPLTQDEAQKTLEDKHFGDRRLGCFDSTGPRIVIYYRNFECFSRREYFAMVANTLAHEFVHYMEYTHCKSQGVSYYKNKKLSEAMADFFALLYSVYNAHTAVAENRYKVWQKRLGTSWPYSEAINFCSVNGRWMNFSELYGDYLNHGCVFKLARVFECCANAPQAYQLLKKL